MNRGFCLFVFLRSTFTDLAIQLLIHKKRDSIRCTEGAAGKDAKTLQWKKKSGGKYKMVYVTVGLV